LEHKYTVYAMNRQKGWSESKIKTLASFGTLNQFWAMYQHIKRPSALPNHTVLNVFEEGVKPVWEVPDHAQGAAWNIRVNKGHADVLWENLLLGLIGE
jgi:translation initiation factor 4E